MLRAQDIRARRHDRPFRLFRSRASESQQFDIYHPDLVFVSIRDLMIGFPGPEHPTIYDHVTRLALVNVVSLEDLPMPPVPGNGQE
jgi:hypothetical protein